MNTAVIGATAGAVFGLIGVLVGQYLTQLRHTEALRQTAELEEQRANQAALLKFFELGGQLIRVPADADYLGPILRAQTLTLLEALAPGHRRILLQFLYESSLLGPENPGLSLRGGDLVRANLSGAFSQEITKECFTQTQINEAVGNDATRLPDRLQRPALEAVWEEELEGSCNETSSLIVRWMRSVWPSQRPGNRLRERKVVVGVGGLGHMAVQILKALTPARILAVDEAYARLREGSLNGRAVVCPNG